MCVDRWRHACRHQAGCATASRPASEESCPKRLLSYQMVRPVVLANVLLTRSLLLSLALDTLALPVLVRLGGVVSWLEAACTASSRRFYRSQGLVESDSTLFDLSENGQTFLFCQAIRQVTWSEGTL